MIGSAVGKRYATALYELAEGKADEGLVAKLGEDLRRVADAWEANEELRGVFQSPQFAVEQKREVARALAERLGAHAMVTNLAQILADRGRLVHIVEIADAYDRIAERRSGRIRAEVVSAIALPEEYYTRLTETLKQATGKDVVLVRREDPSLIAGVVTTVGGRVFDGSLKNRLRELRSELMTSAAET
jgi:F-type H+-transporting ATPase subunit delta